MKPQDKAKQKVIRLMKIESAIGSAYYTLYRVGKLVKCKPMMDWAATKQNESFCTSLVMLLGVFDAVGAEKGYHDKEESA